MHEHSRIRMLGAVALAALIATTAMAVPPTPAAVVVKQGDAIDGSTVSSLNAPFTDGLGQVGFVGALADARRFIWHGAGPIFYSPPGVTGGEGTMGVGNSGQFIYSPSVNGNDAVYTNGGVLLQATDPIPPIPGLFSRFNSRPQMAANGTAYWIGGTAATPTGSTTNRHLFKATDPTNPGTISRVFSGGDVIAGRTLTTTASNFTYWVSDNGNHIHEIETTGPLSCIYVNGSWVAVQGQPSGNGNWQNFDNVSINDSGNYLFSGDTDAAAATDAFIAYNGSLAVKEGETIDGVTLASGAAVRALSISNGGKAAYIWGWGSGGTAQEHLFFGDASNLPGSTRMLSLNDEIDIDHDGFADYKITDFNASGVVGPGLDLADNGLIYVDVDIAPIGSTDSIQAIIAIPEPATLGLLVLGALALLRRRG